MEYLNELYIAIDDFLLRGIFVSVLVIIIAKFILKNKINCELSFSIIRTTMILHSAIYILLLIITLLTHNTEDIFWLRAFGPHWWAYWFMMSMNSLVPFTLLIKRFGKNTIYLLVVSILINFGFIFESFVIHMTNIERDYITENHNPYLPNNHEISVLCHGLIVGVALLIIGYIIKLLKNFTQIKEPLS